MLLLQVLQLFVYLKDHIHIKNYIHYHLTQIYRKAVEFKSLDFQIPQVQIEEFNKITDINSAGYILNKPFYHCVAHGQFTIGQKKASH